MIKRIELLVHAGAPSSRRDDEKYRAQAEGYLGFQGVKIDGPTNVSNKSIQPASPSGPGACHRQGDEIGVTREHATVFLENTQLAYTALDSQLCTSSLADEGNAIFRPREAQKGPQFRGATHVKRKASQCNECSHGSHLRSSQQGALCERQAAITEYQATNDCESSSGSRNSTSNRSPLESHDPRLALGQSQSSYLRSPILDHSNKKRKLNSGAKFNQKEPVKKSTAPAYAPIAGGNHVRLGHISEMPVASIENAPSADAESLSGNDVTSELPTTYSLSDITSDSSRAKARSNISQRSTSDPGPRVEGINSVAAGAPLAANGNSELRDDAGADRLRSNHTITRSAVKAPAIRCQPANPQVPSSEPASNVRSWKPDQRLEGVTKGAAAENQLLTREATTMSSFNDLSTTIHSPEPKADVESFTTHVTEHLRYLAVDLVEADRYKPVHVTREPRTHERGYWLVECSAWTVKLQIDFWQFLEKTIGNGSAGWGVWCVRNDGKADATSATNLGKVQIFCWGEIVKHIYLLLYVASTSQVRKLGLQWIDAEGEVVVQMRKS